MENQLITTADAANQSLCFIYSFEHVIVNDSNGNELGNVNLDDQKKLVIMIINNRPDLKAFLINNLKP